MRKRRLIGGLAVGTVAMLAVMGWFIDTWPMATEVMASTHHTNGPITSDQTGDGSTSHSSKVYYYKDTDPFVAQAYRIYYGGRANSGAHVALARWRRENTDYWEWNGSSWVSVKSITHGKWNNNRDSLKYFNRYDNAFMDVGALVRQRIRHQDTYINGDTGEYYGSWHSHYLE